MDRGGCVHLVLMYLTVVLCVYVTWSSLSFLYMYIHVFHQLQKLWQLFLQILFLPIISFLDSHYMYVGMFVSVPYIIFLGCLRLEGISLEKGGVHPPSCQISARMPWGSCWQWGERLGVKIPLCKSRLGATGLGPYMDTLEPQRSWELTATLGFIYITSND